MKPVESSAMVQSYPTVRVIDSTKGCPELAIIVGEGRARAVIWPGNGAKWRTFNVIELEAGATTIDLQHASDCVYYVEHGSGVVRDLEGGGATAVLEGSMLHIDRGDRYRFESSQGGRLVLIGGPCPADEALYQHIVGKA